ncbi:MAG: MFS transporter [Spirochaetaceae bacterium]|nr:MFS transporter [Spirochaetaceae bacterium]
MSEKKSLYGRIVLFLSCLGIFSASYTQYQLSPLAPKIISSLGLSTSQFTSIFSAPMIPAVFLSLVAGLMVDKFGAKKVIAIGLLISAAGSCLRLTASSYSTLLIYMIMTGFGAAFLNANAAKIFGGWFPPEKISSMMGIFLAASTIAMTVGTGTTALFPSITSAYATAAVVSVFAAVLWIALMKNPVSTGADNVPPSRPISESLKVVAKSSPVWIVGLCLMCILASNITISSFLPTALGGRGISSVAAGAFSTAITLGFFVGCLFAPLIATKLGKMKPLMFVFGLISAFGVAFAWLSPQGALLWIGLFITGIAMGGLMPLLMSIPIQLPEIGPTYAGTAGGFTGTLQLLGAVVVPAYIIAPIAGSNMKLFFILGGVCMAVLCVLVLFLPELGAGAKTKVRAEQKTA